MNLTIEQIEVFDIAMPLQGTFTSGGVSKSATKCVVVRITASDGSVGISSIDPSTRATSPHTGPELAGAIRERIAPELIGQDPTNIHRILARAHALTPNQPGAAVGVELACIELTCQRLGVAMHAYLGGALTDELRFNGWIGELPPEQAAVEAKRWLDAGFLSAKIKVGSGVERDHDRIAAIRDTVGSAMELRMDANEQYDAATAIELCQVVKQYDLQLFEQPTPAQDLAGLARVRREGGIAVMADESISDHASLLRLIKADCADYVKFGIKQVGGMLCAARMLATAEAAGLPVVLGHGFGLDMSTMAEIMLGATSATVVAGLECVGPLKVADTVATTRIDISAGVITLPNQPGLGLTLDDAKLAQYQQSPVA